MRHKTQCPKCGKPGGLPRVSWNPRPISGKYTQQRELDDQSVQAGLTDLQNQMEQTEFAAGHLINIKIAIDSLLLKEKAQMKDWKLEMKQSAECIIPLCCRRQSFYQSP